MTHVFTDHQKTQVVFNHTPTIQNSIQRTTSVRSQKQPRKKHFAGKIICGLFLLLLTGIVVFAIVAPNQLTDFIHRWDFLEKAFSKVAEWFIHSLQELSENLALK